MPNTCILATIWVLLLQPGHSQNDIVVDNVGNDKIDRVASLDAHAIAYAHHMLYEGRSAQWLAIDRSDCRRFCDYLFLPPCLCPTHSDGIGNCLAYEIICGAQIDQCPIGQEAIALLPFCIPTSTMRCGGASSSSSSSSCSLAAVGPSDAEASVTGP